MTDGTTQDSGRIVARLAQPLPAEAMVDLFKALTWAYVDRGGHLYVTTDADGWMVIIHRRPTPDLDDDE